MIARVVTKREDARLALLVTMAAALGLAWVLADDLWGSNVFRPPGSGAYLFIAALIAAGALGPWLAWTRRGEPAIVHCESGLVRAGDLVIETCDITGLSVAEAARGASVAVARGRDLVFLEVERAGDAERLAEALNVPSTPFGELGVAPASRALAVGQALLSMLGILFAPLYFIAASRGFEPFPAIQSKALFGVGGVVVTQLAMLVLMTRRFMRGQAVALGRGAWDAHVSLHGIEAVESQANAARSEDEQREHAEARAQEHARAQPIRVGHLGRGEEEVGAWLARLDAIPDEAHAYRGDAMKKDVLWETLGDVESPVDARMAAARILQRRYGEDQAALVRVVEDPDVRVRVEAALEDHDEAEDHIERLGPLFRAR